MGVVKSEQAKGLILERKTMTKSVGSSRRTDHKVNAAFVVRIVLNT
jgi:hypothetical protein